MGSNHLVDRHTQKITSPDHLGRRISSYVKTGYRTAREEIKFVNNNGYKLGKCETSVELEYLSRKCALKFQKSSRKRRQRDNSWLVLPCQFSLSKGECVSADSGICSRKYANLNRQFANGYKSKQNRMWTVPHWRVCLCDPEKTPSKYRFGKSRA